MYGGFAEGDAGVIIHHDEPAIAPGAAGIIFRPVVPCLTLISRDTDDHVAALAGLGLVSCGSRVLPRSLIT